MKHAALLALILTGCAGEPPPEVRFTLGDVEEDSHGCTSVGSWERQYVNHPDYDPGGCTLFDRLRHVKKAMASVPSHRID